MLQDVYEEGQHQTFMVQPAGTLGKMLLALQSLLCPANVLCCMQPAENSAHLHFEKAFMRQQENNTIQYNQGGQGAPCP